MCKIVHLKSYPPLHRGDKHFTRVRRLHFAFPCSLFPLRVRPLPLIGPTRLRSPATSLGGRASYFSPISYNLCVLFEFYNIRHRNSLSAVPLMEQRTDGNGRSSTSRQGDEIGDGTTQSPKRRHLLRCGIVRGGVGMESFERYTRYAIDCLRMANGGNMAASRRTCGGQSGARRQ